MSLGMMRLRVLDAFLVEAQGMKSDEALYDLVASTAARLTGSTHAMVWVVSGADAGEQCHICVYGPDTGPALAPQECPGLVRQLIGSDGATHHTDVAPEQLGLPAGARFPTGTGWVWVSY